MSPFESLLAAAAVLGTVTLFGATLVDILDPSAEAASARAVPPSGIGLTIRTARAEILDAPPTLTGLQPVTATLTDAELQSVIDDWLADNAVAGVAVGIRRADGSSWAGSAGRDVERGGDMTPGRAFAIASVTKTFTAALVMQLVDEGKLTLDDPLSRYVPDFPHGREITIRNLIQHTSGVMSTDGVPPAEALRVAAEVPPIRAGPIRVLHAGSASLAGAVSVALHVRADEYRSTARLSDAMDEELDHCNSTHPVAKPALVQPAYCARRPLRPRRRRRSSIVTSVVCQAHSPC
jgi:CubicO group peptidase (beta-lactamase class C family)